MEGMGYQRVPQPSKIYLTPSICQRRLVLANTLTDPSQILWTDETWVNGMPLGNQRLTISPGENPKQFASVWMRANG